MSGDQGHAPGTARATDGPRTDAPRSNTPGSDTPRSDAPSEARRVAAIIAQTSTELSGGAEATITAVIVERFAASGMHISTLEAGRIAHDIARAPKHRSGSDD